MTDIIKGISAGQGYNQEIHDQAFYLWYKLGKPNLPTLHKMMEDKGMVTPVLGTLTHWKMADNWETHADSLDGISDNAMDKEIILQRAELIKKQADIGTELIDLGMAYLHEHGIDTSADAIRSIAKGAELQEKQLGWAAVFTELANANDADLDKKLRKFMTDDIVEGTTVDAGTEEPEDKSESDE